MKLNRVEILGRERSGNCILLRYRWGGASPEPGQFVMARPAATFPVPFLPRPFFIHDHEGETISLLFEVRGRGTTLLAEEDTGIAVSGPLGKGFVVEGEGPVALVGGGVWASPLGLLSRRLRESGIPYELYLETPDGVSRACARQVQDAFPGAIGVSASGSPGAFLEHYGYLSRYSLLCASGPAGMSAAVKSVSRDGLPAQLAVRERMACADGSCHGCAVPVYADGELTYARACVEGPVFPAEVLAW